MGDNVLKRITLLITLSSLLFANGESVNLSWVDKEIEAIKPPRKGISQKKIALIKDPFIFLEKNRTKKDKKSKKGQNQLPPVVSGVDMPVKTGMPKRSFKLAAIINDAAFINNKWYKIGQEVGGYKIVKVTMTKVTLRGPDETLTLTTDSRKKLKVGRENEKDDK